MQMQSTGINPARSCALVSPSVHRNSVDSLYVRGLSEKRLEKKDMQTRAIWRNAVTQTLRVISTRTIGNFCACPHALQKTAILHWNLSEYNRSIQIASTHHIVSFWGEKKMVVKRNKRVTSSGKTHDEAATINKWRRYVHWNEVLIQADIWFYKNANKIRLFTSGIGVPRCAM